MKTISAGLLVSALVGVALHAQQAGFEVATVKILPPVPLGTSLSINLGTYRNGSMSMNNVTLSEALQFAYGLVSEDQVSGPDWIKSRDTRYEIVAKTTADVDLEHARAMVAALLAERLKVVAHNEPKAVSFLALVQAPGGSKLVPAADPQGPPPQNANSFFPGRISGPSVPVGVLALLLSRFERQLVIDRTGLAGRYQMKLVWMPEELPTALEEQLGLQLESRKEPLDAIVVERAEKMPLDN